MRNPNKLIEIFKENEVLDYENGTTNSYEDIKQYVVQALSINTTSHNLREININFSSQLNVVLLMNSNIYIYIYIYIYIRFSYEKKSPGGEKNIVANHIQRTHVLTYLISKSQTQHKWATTSPPTADTTS